MAPIALALNVNPNTLMICTTLAASCAFMLPVATAPNAVVFGSKLLKISDMVRVGFWMNIISIVILTIVVYFFLPLIWN
jgi:sodium-dependent dicarboxylate transporter 2/3/5